MRRSGPSRPLDGKRCRAAGPVPGSPGDDLGQWLPVEGRHRPGEEPRLEVVLVGCWCTPGPRPGPAAFPEDTPIVPFVSSEICASTTQTPACARQLSPKKTIIVSIR